MKEERLKILKMVEDGKISVDDAEKLMNACTKERRHHHRHHEFEFDREEFEEKAREFSKSAEKFAKDAQKRAGELYKGVEPHLRKGAQFVVEKTALVADEIANALNDALANMKRSAEAGDEADGCCCCSDTEEEGNVEANSN